MINNTLCSIGGLIFLIILIVVYNIRTKQTNISNKSFKYSLYTLVFVIVAEIGALICINASHPNYFWGNIFARINSVTTIIWCMSITGCLMTLNEADKVPDAKNYFKTNKSMKIANLVFYGLMVIISLFLKIENVVEPGKSYISGSAEYILYIVGVITVIVVFLIVRHAKRDFIKLNVTPIIIGCIASVISMALQLVFPYYLILTECFVLNMYLIYFMFENPDLYLIREFQRAKQKADESNKAKTDFLSNMSHEIRTPMNAIMGFSESILNDKEFNEDSIRKDVNHIYSAGSSLLEIINNILDISKIETGEEVIENKEYSIKSIVLELKSIIEARIPTSKLRFITNIDDTIPSVYIGDKTKLFQILLNILSNSVKYTEVGKIELRLSADVSGDKATLHFRISDTGYGIKKEDYDKLFEKFSRLEIATQKEIEGTGLGLVITKRLVTLLGGKIWFTSEYGAGTIFYVDLIQKIADSTPIGNLLISGSAKNDDKTYIDCSNYNVLIVDDNMLNLKVAQKLLSKYGFNITTVLSGKECIDSIKIGEKYDIIFLDHMMPGMDGIEVLHILRGLEDFKLPPIVALTANAITGMREMYLNEGFDEYLSKPININELDKLINKYFKGKE